MIRALVAGLLLATAASGYWFGAIAGVALLYRALDDPSWRRRFAIGWSAAFVAFLFTLSWTRQFTLPGWPLLSAFEALFLGFGCVATPNTKSEHRAETSRSRLVRAIGFVAAVVVGELLRLRVPFGGLPMGGLSSGQARGPLAPVVSIVGELGLVGVVVMCGVAVSEIRRIDPMRWLGGLTLGGAVLVLVLAGSQVGTVKDGVLRVAVVQAGGRQATPPSDQRPDEVFEAHLRATLQAETPVDLILWPEDVVETAGPIGAHPHARSMSELAQSFDATVAAGVVESGENAFRNALVVWDEGGNISDRYDKILRVPFGEYIPGRSFVERVADVSAVPNDAVAGTGPRVVEVAGRRAGVLISYEGLFATLGRQGVRQGGDLLLVPTNASSYRSSKVSRIQVDSARLRALETRRWVVQAAPTGKSVIVDDRGRIRQQSAIGPGAVLQETVHLSSTATPYVRWGDAPTVTISLLILTLICLRTLTSRRKQRSRSAQQAPTDRRRGG